MMLHGCEQSSCCMLTCVCAREYPAVCLRSHQRRDQRRLVGTCLVNNSRVISL